MNKPFNLEAFKNGQKALTRDGRVASFVGICNNCADRYKLLAIIDSNDAASTYFLKGNMHGTVEVAADLVSMVSRHQHLIDSYGPEDTWQFKKTIEKVWDTLQNTDPQWLEDYDYRLHPHNDLIKAWKKGAKIEAYIVGDWIEKFNPDWYEDTQYRIKPTTKTVYEWIHEANVGNVNYFVSSWVADEDVEYFFGLDAPKQKYKTGRSWEVEV